MPQIDHVVVLMLENRSFDSMLGWLKPGDPNFRGLTGNESNPQTGPGLPPIKVWNQTGSDPATMSTPSPDPGERFSEDINAQLFGVDNPTSGAPTMDGFVINYIGQPGVSAAGADAVMHYFTPDQVPVISQLATAFGVSDCWHASAPCQTWPNRFFVHTATAGGYVNNSPVHFPYTMKSVYELLDAKGLAWKIYFHDIPQSATLANIWESGATNFRRFEADFVADAMAGNLPAYSFIEPRYFSSSPLQLIPNDEHPPHNVHYGEQLIATVYNALRSGPNWHQTLFILTYDEHGGCFDHVPPPAAAAPGGPAPDGFAFDRYGVRVPAVIVSPYIPVGSVVRPPDGSPYPFDHTSIISTLRAIFDLDGPLTGRDAVAPDLLGALSLDGPTNDGPSQIVAPGEMPTPDEVTAYLQRPPNDHQESLCMLAAHLPRAGSPVDSHINALQQEIVAPVCPDFETSEKAGRYVENRANWFIGLSRPVFMQRFSTSFELLANDAYNSVEFQFTTIPTGAPISLDFVESALGRLPESGVSFVRRELSRERQDATADVLADLLIELQETSSRATSTELRDSAYNAAQSILAAEIPVKNSPLKGENLSTLLANGSIGAAVLAGHVSYEQIPVAIFAGASGLIIFSLARGIADALEVVVKSKILDRYGIDERKFQQFHKSSEKNFKNTDGFIDKVNAIDKEFGGQ